jgi:hypothetical protein
MTNTTTITPIPGALDEFNARYPGHVDKLCEALQTSAKHRKSMCNDDDTAHCCMCVSARVEGATKKQYGGASMPQVFYAPASHALSDIHIALFNRQPMLPSSLNDMGHDAYHTGPDISHQQIAELLQGRAVTVEVSHD